jgi:phospholipid/cholesterol/gamma-HCH transport system ATP-binding protein
MEPFIHFQDVHKSFDQNEVYKGLSLDIYKGETITIIGGSGTGKSVMLKMLLGLIQPDRGEIFFDGEDVTKMDHESLIKMRRRIGMLFQGAALFDSLTVAENVAYPLVETGRRKERKESYEEVVREKLEMVGLPDTGNVMPSDLSGGMKKRVALARAIATDPEVILYDEPTTGLDPTNINRINELILDLQKKLKVTSIAVTHDMSSAFTISDRLALVYNKKIEFVGTKEEVKNSKNEIVQKFIHGEIGE